MNHSLTIRLRLEAAVRNSALLGVLCVVALAGCSTSAPTTVAVTDSPAASPTITESDLLDALNLPVTLEEMRELEPSELKALTEISVESVSSGDGSINWVEVVRRTYENYNLQVNAGATVGELNSVTNQGLDFETYFVDKYGVHLESGYTAVSLEGLRAIQLNTLASADLQNLRMKEVTVRTIFSFTGVEVITSNENGAVVNVQERVVDNFFSSGAIEPDNANIIANLGRSDDLDRSSTQQISYSIIGGKVFLTDTEYLQ